MGIHTGNVVEVVNRNLFVSAALQVGYVAFLPVYDPGIDLILYREADGRLFKVRLKSRWTIDRELEGRDLWIAFPAKEEWYLAPHDEMVKRAPESVLSSDSGRAGASSSANLSAETLEKLAEFKLAAIEAPLAEVRDAERSAEDAALQRAAAFEAIMRFRRSLADQPPFTADEIIEMKNEGRRF